MGRKLAAAGAKKRLLTFEKQVYNPAVAWLNEHYPEDGAYDVCAWFLRQELEHVHRAVRTEASRGDQDTDPSGHDSGDGSL